MNTMPIYAVAAAGLTLLVGSAVADHSTESRQRSFVIAPLVAGIATIAFLTLSASWGFIAAGAVAGAFVGFSFCISYDNFQPKDVLMTALIFASYGVVIGGLATLHEMGKLEFGLSFRGSIFPTPTLNILL